MAVKMERDRERERERETDKTMHVIASISIHFCLASQCFHDLLGKNFENAGKIFYRFDDISVAQRTMMKY